MHLLLLVCWREWRETGKGELGAWSSTMIGHLGGSQIISNHWIMGSRITVHIYIYVCVCVCLYTNSYVHIQLYTCVRITDCAMQRISPAPWIAGLRSILSVVIIYSCPGHAVTPGSSVARLGGFSSNQVPLARGVCILLLE